MYRITVDIGPVAMKIQDDAFFDRIGHGELNDAEILAFIYRQIYLPERDIKLIPVISREFLWMKDEFIL
jgi:hypothetical protein